MALDERWHEYARTRSRELRNELVEANLGLGAHIAQRYSTRGIDEDVRQVAFLAVVKAVERFDPERGVPFSAFAGRTIEGEIKRYFRDSSWTLRVPRAVQERSLGVARLSEQLAQRLGRSPSVSELADYLHVSNDEVVEAIAAGSAARPQSIDVAEDGHVPSALGSEDNALLGVLDRVLVERLMAILPEREREIVRLRYFEQMSQTGIAEVIGISQMHVSRLLRRSLDALNVLLVDGADRDGADMVTSD
ncbi:MAG: sigma-70 family RNA polymerase sigma factor [Actinomycetota bacterium]|nr:sigma-70 family RNA polymerase sigma factor [Actinomycetota bacterium]